MTKFLFALVIIITASLPAFAQEDKSTINAFVGYSYLRVKGEDVSPTVRIHGANLNGWQGNATYFFSEYFGATADIAGNYGRIRATVKTPVGTFTDSVSARLHTFHVGPTARYGVSKATVFARALVGAARLSGGGFDAEYSFSYAIGAGADWPLSKRFAIRVAQLEYVSTDFDSPTGDRQHGFRYSTGIVGRF
jgi:outer membrane protein with beta-barrel domain